MKFHEFALLCVALKSTSKKLYKIQLLYECSLHIQGEELMRVYDIVSGNFFREISKKEVGISFRTIIDVLGEMYQVKPQVLLQEFQSHGDIFKLIAQFNTTNKSLVDSTDLSVEEFIEVLRQISTISGKSATHYKKQKLQYLFSKTQLLEERQVLCALLSDLLKIGTNEGILHEAFIFSFFPKIEGFHYYSQTNSVWMYTSSIEDEYKKFKHSLLSNVSSESASRDMFILFDTSHNSQFETLSLDSVHALVKYSFSYAYYTIETHDVSPKELYEQIRLYVERMYSFIISYQEMYKQLGSDSFTLLTPPIVFSKPIQVMLGPRLYSFEEANERVDFPVFCDYKYDGLRLIIQNEYGNVKLFSRNLEDLTSQFEEIIRFIQDNFSHTSCVLDAECIGFNKNTFEQVAFQELSKRIMTKSHNLKITITIGLRIFDILKLNDELVYLQPLRKRQELLRSLFIHSQILVEKKRKKEDVVEELDNFFSD